MASFPEITEAERAIVALAVNLRCSIAAEMERRIRGDERMRVVERLRDRGVVAISREPSFRRVAMRWFPAADVLEAELRRDERLLIIRELRREARIGGAGGLDGAALESAAAQLEIGAI